MNTRIRSNPFYPNPFYKGPERRNVSSVAKAAAEYKHIDFSKPLTKEEETFVIEQYHKIIDGDNKGIDSPDIKEYEHKIGMSQLIKIHLDIRRNSRGDHGKYWMTLSPSWISKDDKTHDTKFRIIYWVNYGDDETYGWFTVEQIRQWLETPNLKLYKLGGRRERIVE